MMLILVIGTGRKEIYVRTRVPTRDHSIAPLRTRLVSYRGSAARELLESSRNQVTLVSRDRASRELERFRIEDTGWRLVVHACYERKKACRQYFVARAVDGISMFSFFLSFFSCCSSAKRGLDSQRIAGLDCLKLFEDETILFVQCFDMRYRFHSLLTATRRRETPGSFRDGSPADPKAASGCWICEPSRWSGRTFGRRL